MTMRGQPAAYWAGAYETAFEANPVVEWCMMLHPLAFHALTLVWLAIIFLVIVKTPRLLARTASLAITFSHAFCTGTWLYRYETGYYYALALCISSAITYVLALEMSGDETV